VGAGAVTRGAGGRIIPGVSSPPARLEPAAVPPELRALLPAGFELEPARHGQSTAAAFVRGEGEALVLKHAVEVPYVGWLVVEAEVLRALADEPLPVPRVRGVVKGEREAWLLLTRLPGEPLVELLPHVPTPARQGWFRRLGELLAKIHVTPVPPALRSRDATPWRPRPGRPFAEPGGSSEAFSATHLDRPALSPPSVLVHGDFTLDNVLADASGPCGVVDWGGAGRGDPRYDVALALLSASESPCHLPDAACVRAFYDGYLDVVAGLDPSLYACFSATRDGS
jgi:aminoglycoside phosphotransferase (APT) family kinase protein